MASNILIEISTHRRILRSANLQPRCVFVSRTAYAALRMCADGSLYCIVIGGNVLEEVQGLRLYVVDTDEYLVRVSL